jgi:hypothetical protein
VRKHFPNIPRPHADTDTESNADADANTNTNPDADANTHADANTDAVARALERHDNGEPEPGVADKPARGWLRREHAQPVGVGADPRE